MQNELSMVAIVQRLRSQAHKAYSRSQAKPVVSPRDVRTLLEHWKIAERAGVRFLSDRIMLDGVQFQLSAE